MIIRATQLLVVLLLTVELRANDLQVSTTRVHLDESVRVIVSLTGSFAEREEITLPLRNFAIETGPRMSSEFSWVNGVTSRQRTFAYTLKPLSVGAATIGPITIVDDQGRRDTLGPVEVTVLPDSTAAFAADPVAMMRHLRATGRSRVAVGVELDQRRAFVGEQLLVTWYLYTAESVETVSVTAAPPMSDFWTEEISVNRADDREEMIDGMAVRKVPVRRAAIFPLRDGTLTIPQLEVTAEVMEVTGSAFDRFGMLNTRTVPVRRKSQTASVVAVAAPGTQVGTYSMRCTNPKVSETGLVSFDAVVTGDGNLRSADAPRFVAAPEAEVQFTPGEMKVERETDGVTMRRTWRVLLFPRRSGVLPLPTVSFGYFDPVAAQARAVTCAFPPLSVMAAKTQSDDAAADTPAPATRSCTTLLLTLGLAAVAAIIAARMLRQRRNRRQLERRARELLDTDSSLELRRRFDQLLESAKVSRAVLSEASERGELARAVSSLIEYRIAQPSHAREVDDELLDRLIELIRELRV